MATNKVVINTENGPKTLIDLTQDSVTPETLAEGATAHDASGNTIIGTAFGAILTVEETDGGVKLTATNKDGSSEAVLKNGENGKDGANGTDGKSAYAYAQDGGYAGTETEFASDLSNTSKKVDSTYLIPVFEELKTAIQESNIDNAVAILDRAILDLSKLS